VYTDQGNGALQASPLPWSASVARWRPPSSRTRRSQYDAAWAFACARRRNDVTRCSGVDKPPYVHTAHDVIHKTGSRQRVVTLPVEDHTEHHGQTRQWRMYQTSVRCCPLVGQFEYSPRCQINATPVELGLLCNEDVDGINTSDCFS